MIVFNCKMICNININRLIQLLFTTIVTIQLIGCSSDKSSNILQPDENINSRYLSVRYLQFSSNQIDVGEQLLGTKTVKSFSVSNHEKNYPIKFSIDGILNNITLLDTSTCPIDNATVYPGEDCVYSVLLSNDEVGERLDNITFHDNYSEVHLGVLSKTSTRNFQILSDNSDVAEQSKTSTRDTQDNSDVVERSKTSTQGVLVVDSSTQNALLIDNNIVSVASVNFPLTVNKEYHSFGSVNRGSKDISTDFIISNSSSSQVDFDVLPLISGGYIIHPVSTCKIGSNKLNAGQSCLIKIVFSPTSSGIYNDSFQVSYKNEKVSVSLTGVGAKRYTDINSLQLSNDVIDYGTVINGEYRDYSVTVKNRSNDLFMKFSLSDIEDGFSYLSSSTCGVYFTTLPPNQSCELSIRYLSQSEGGSVNVWVGNLYKEIKLLSNSSNEDILSIAQSIVDFDNILVNSANSNTFTLNNVSAINQSINITSSDDITIINTPTTIGAGSSQVIDFVLQPQNVDRDYKSNIKIGTNDGLNYILPVKAEVVAGSNIDATQFLSSASIGEKVYIYDDNMFIYNPLIDNKSNQLYSYNLSSLTLSKIENAGDVQSYGRGTDLILFNDVFYLFGGEDKEGNLSDNLSYFDTVNKKWHDIVIDDGDIKPTARKGYKGVVAKDKLYIMGGVDISGNQLDDIWSYDLNRRSKGWSKVEITPLFTAVEINDNDTIFLSYNDSLYIVVADKVYSYRIDNKLEWKEEYSIVGTDVLENIDAIISNKVLYLTGSKFSNNTLFIRKLDMNTGQTVEIETGITINENFKSILQLNNDSLIYLFLMFDDKVSSEFYYLNDISSKFVEIDTQIYPYVERIDTSVSYKEYMYYLGSNKKLYSYNLNTKRFERKSLMNCVNISTTITPNLISDNNRNKLYVVDGSNFICEYDIKSGNWTESNNGAIVGVKANFSVAIYDNHLWMYGGINSDSSVSDKLWKYDINGNLGWIEVVTSSSDTTSNYDVYDHKMVVYGDALYIVGGYSDLLKNKNNSIFKIDLSKVSVSVETVSTLDVEKQLSDNFGIALYKTGFVLLGLNDIKNDAFYYNIVDNDFTIYKSIGGDYFDKEHVSKVISFGSALYIQNNIYSRVSKIILED